MQRVVVSQESTPFESSTMQLQTAPLGCLHMRQEVAASNMMHRKTCVLKIQFKITRDQLNDSI